MDLETVLVEQRGGELRITLNRPEAMNAWNTQFGNDLRAAVEHAAAEESVRAVVATGAGRAFSSGADLKAGFEPTPEGHPDVLTPLRERYHPIIAGLRRMPKPVLAAGKGPAGGHRFPPPARRGPGGAPGGRHLPPGSLRKSGTP